MPATALREFWMMDRRLRLRRKGWPKLINGTSLIRLFCGRARLYHNLAWVGLFVGKNITCSKPYLMNCNGIVVIQFPR